MTVEEAKQELWWEQATEFMRAYYQTMFHYRLEQRSELFRAYPWLRPKS